MGFSPEIAHSLPRCLPRFTGGGNRLKHKAVWNIRLYKRRSSRMSDLGNTQFFQVEPGPQISAKDILEIVFKALKEKGYNPVNQIVGYIMSGDPTYITSYNGARSLVMKVERDELVEELLKAYIEHNSWE